MCCTVQKNFTLFGAWFIPCSVFLWGVCMKHYLIMCRSITGAQRAERLLERSLIHAAAVKAPKSLTRSGCGYAVRIRSEAERALMILRKNEIAIGKIYLTEDGKEYREVLL